MPNILLISSGLVHPGPLARWRLCQLLGKCTSATITQHSSLERVSTEDYSQVQLAVLYFHHKQVSEKAFTRFEHYLKSGGSVLALHAATASFKQFAPWFDVLGGRFIGHGPIQSIEVSPNVPATLLNDMPSFNINEELYHHEICGDVDIHLTAMEGQVQHPVVWTKTHGTGHLAYMVFGHRGKAFTDPHVAKITATLINWLMEQKHGA